MNNKVLTIDAWLKAGTVIQNKEFLKTKQEYKTSPSIAYKVETFTPGAIFMYLGSSFEYEAPGSFSDDLGCDYGFLRIRFDLLHGEKIVCWFTDITLDEYYDTVPDAESMAVKRIFDKTFTIL